MWVKNVMEGQRRWCTLCPQHSGGGRSLNLRPIWATQKRKESEGGRGERERGQEGGRQEGVEVRREGWRGERRRREGGNERPHGDKFPPQSWAL